MEPSLTRKIAQSPLYVGKNETVPFTLDFAGFVPAAVTSLSSAAVTLHDITRGEPGTDVSSTKLSGSPSFTNLVLTLPLITGLADGGVYLLRARGSSGGATYELWGLVRGER